MIELRGASATYPDGTIPFRDLSCIVGGVDTAILGANGAGKSSLLRALTGAIPLTEGEYRLHGELARRISPQQLVRQGVVHVPQGRAIFPDLSVRNNLRLGAFVDRRAKGLTQATTEMVVTLFPRLRERFDQIAGTLSGGEQQMLAIGRALMCRPRHLIVDELSLGLAPMITAQIYEALLELKKSERMVLTLVEQDVTHALRAAEHCYVLENGRVVFDGPAAELDAGKITSMYLGT